MAHTFIYNNLLSFSKNRECYRTLFDISIRKRKILDRDYEEIDLLTVCDELLKQTRNKKSFKTHRKMFYLASQLTFGTLYLYKSKTEDLLLKVRSAMIRCNSTFGDPLLSFSQSSIDTTNQSRKGIKRKHVNPFAEIVLLDDDEDQTAEFKKPFDIKRPKVTNVDPTLVSNVESITLLESLPVTQSIMSLTNNAGDDDGFGEMTEQDVADLFYIPEDPFQSVQQSQSVALTTQQDEGLSEMAGVSQIPSANTISVTVEIHSQSSALDHQELSDRDWERPDIIRENKSVIPDNLDLIESVPIDENNNCTAGNTFDMNQNHLPILPDIQESHMTLDSNACSHLQIPDIVITLDNDLNEDTEVFAIDRKSKKAKKRSLIVDKITMIPSKKMRTQLESYDDLKIERPLNTFNFRMLDIELSLENLMAHPLRRNISNDLLHLYQRNLMKPKRTRGRIPVTSTPKKKREDTTTVPDISEIPKNTVLNDITNVPNQTTIPDISEIPKNSAPEINEITEIEPVPIVPGNQSTTATASAIAGGEYNEKDKWSREKILETLKTFWSTGQTPVNLEMFNIRNRFVFAGVFFELLTLKKLNVIELVQQEDDLRIFDIQKGVNFHKKY